MQQKYREDPDYIEWDADARVLARRQDENAPIEMLFDAEIRRRIGEVIARAAEGAKRSEGDE